MHDPSADINEAKKCFNIDLSPREDINGLDAIIIAVTHDFYKEIPIDQYAGKLTKGGCLIDVKSILNPEDTKESSSCYWRL